MLSDLKIIDHDLVLDGQGELVLAQAKAVIVTDLQHCLESAQLTHQLIGLEQEEQEPILHQITFTLEADERVEPGSIGLSHKNKPWKPKLVNPFLRKIDSSEGWNPSEQTA